jgi:hypothetical protein
MMCVSGVCVVFVCKLGFVCGVIGVCVVFMCKLGFVCGVCGVCIQVCVWCECICLSRCV